MIVLQPYYFCTRLAPLLHGAFFMHAIVRIAVCAFLGIASQAQAFPWYAGGDSLRGGELMSPDERRAHVARLQSMRSFDECRAYMRGHYLELDRRAQDRRVSLPPVKGDPCEVMRTMGRY